MRTAMFLLLAACSFDHGRSPTDGGGGGSDSGSDGGSGSDAGPDMMMSTLREKTITIGSSVNGTHSDFPLWIALTDPDIGARSRSDGTDIHFVAGTTQLAYEIQRWNKTDGRLEAWVRIPTLAAGTTLAVRYGDVAVAHAANSATTFNAYNAVWHFEDPLNNATIVDSRGVNNGTGVNLGPSDSVAAQLGRGIDFNDNAEQVTIANPLAGAMPHTISAWVNQGTTMSNDALITLGPGGTTSEARWLHTRYNGAEVAVGFYTNDWTNVNYDVIGDGWVLVHWVFEGANRMSRLYVNGTQVAGPFQHDTGIDTKGNGGVIGNGPIAFGMNMGINAIVDEVRIIDVVRSDTWIATESANQTSPSTFYTVGAEQTP